MKALQIDELRKWFDESPSGIKVDPTGHLRYPTRNPLGIRLDVPAEARRAVALASSLLAVEGDAGFSGALIYFTDWGYSPPQIENCAVQMLEQMRRGYGVTASVENAPGQIFRSDEIVDAQAFLAIPLLFGWDAYFVPHGTRCFAYARENASLFLVTDDEEVLQKLQGLLDPYRPVPELPSYLQSTRASL
jgi:hypothetical protein